MYTKKMALPELAKNMLTYLNSVLIKSFKLYYEHLQALKKQNFLTSGAKNLSVLTFTKDLWRTKVQD